MVLAQPSFAGGLGQPPGPCVLESPVSVLRRQAHVNCRAFLVCVSRPGAALCCAWVEQCWSSSNNPKPSRTWLFCLQRVFDLVLLCSVQSLFSTRTPTFLSPVWHEDQA